MSSTSFNNLVVLAKLLVNTRQAPANVLVAELYEELQRKEVPPAEWPNWIVTRMSGGRPLSAWL